MTARSLISSASDKYLMRSLFSLHWRTRRVGLIFNLPVESRRTKTREGVKMPQNLRATKITFAEIAESTLAWSRANKRSFGHDEQRMPRLVEQFGTRPAEDIEPGEIMDWLDSRADWSLATRNRLGAMY
jgi:hypothetical protein